MGFSVDRRCYEDGGTEPGGRGGGRVFSKGISDSRLSNELSLSLTVCVCVSWGPRVHVTTERGGETGRVHGRRSMERRGTLIGTSDGTVMPIN